MGNWRCCAGLWGRSDRVLAHPGGRVRGQAAAAVSAGAHLNARWRRSGTRTRSSWPAGRQRRGSARARPTWRRTPSPGRPAGGGRLARLEMAILAGDGVAEVAAQALADAYGVKAPQPGTRGRWWRRHRCRAGHVGVIAAGDTYARTEGMEALPRSTRPATGLLGRDHGRLRGARAALLGVAADMAMGPDACRAARDGRPPGQRLLPRPRIGGEVCWPHILRRLGAIAQLGERRAGSAKVTGSSPVSSIPWFRFAAYGCSFSSIGGRGRWRKLKSALTSPRIGWFSRTLGRGSGRPSVLGLIR